MEGWNAGHNFERRPPKDHHSQVEWRVGMLDTILKGDQPWTISQVEWRVGKLDTILKGGHPRTISQFG
jgi:hypothetical protein